MEVPGGGTSVRDRICRQLIRVEPKVGRTGRHRYAWILLDKISMHDLDPPPRSGSGYLCHKAISWSQCPQLAQRRTNQHYVLA
jgi:hypothetical protein